MAHGWGAVKSDGTILFIRCEETRRPAGYCIDPPASSRSRTIRTMSSSSSSSSVDHTVVDTVQSLIVAFVLAMTFRGFVVEGFVIPTGSMAPTLLGDHQLIHSRATGAQFPVNFEIVDPDRVDMRTLRYVDQMVGPNAPLVRSPEPQYLRPRTGDRILVFKGLYPFREPDRYDVVVFTNPTNPHGSDRNYIKRLIGRPNEAVWLIDGDVFTARHNDGQLTGPFEIRRKPDHVQRAVWQPVYHSDYAVVRSGALAGYDGPPWEIDACWSFDDRVLTCETDAPTTLRWRSDRRDLNDWNVYNSLLHQSRSEMRMFHTSDLRFAAAIVPEREGVSTVLELTARSHVFEFAIDDDRAAVRMRPTESDGDQWTHEVVASMRPLRPGRPTHIEFWHVDQRMAVFVDNRLVVELTYDDWTPQERTEHSYNRSFDEVTSRLPVAQPVPPEVTWRFAGSPLTLHRVRVDRDLYYQPTEVSSRNSPTGMPMPGAATHPRTVLKLGPDHFFMLGDNSAASLDGRSWGTAHPLIAAQIDPSPFVVHRRLLLGKAWVVYFPAPLSISPQGVRFIPDFGRMRFIR